MNALANLLVDEGIARIRLNRPERHNALTPALLDDLMNCLVCAEAHVPDVLVLSAEGKSFSTGGDIAGFLAEADDPERLAAYSERIVGALHDVILKMLAFPAPMLCAVNGPVTGGALGLVLAADMVAMSETAFLQPYYGVVGFGPDGGWTALLPERIGTAKALELQYLNTRLTAAEARDLGLAAAVLPRDGLDRQIDAWTDTIATQNPNTLKTTRASVWDDARIAKVRQRLDQEKERFLERVIAADTHEGMTRFRT